MRWLDKTQKNALWCGQRKRKIQGCKECGMSQPRARGNLTLLEQTCQNRMLTFWEAAGRNRLEQVNSHQRSVTFSAVDKIKGNMVTVTNKMASKPTFRHNPQMEELLDLIHTNQSYSNSSLYSIQMQRKGKLKNTTSVFNIFEKYRESTKSLTNYKKLEYYSWK